MRDDVQIDPAKFWAWAYSNFLSNALRGVLAEFIVAQAMGHVQPRVQWDAFDLKTDDGLGIEVKSSAYLQSWEQVRPSLIRFDIDLKRGWEAVSNTRAGEARRSADLYVFCVFATRDRAVANPLCLDQWFFLICPTWLLNQAFPRQKTVSLSALERLYLKRVEYRHLNGAIRSVELHAPRNDSTSTTNPPGASK